ACLLTLSELDTIPAEEKFVIKTFFKAIEATTRDEALQRKWIADMFPYFAVCWARKTEGPELAKVQIDIEPLAESPTTPN
ncbi:MAG: hypothetical protein ACKPKO_37110, partial [Candidatus Fonsibacter sp.]